MTNVRHSGVSAALILTSSISSVRSVPSRSFICLLDFICNLHLKLHEVASPRCNTLVGVLRLTRKMQKSFENLRATAYKHKAVGIMAEQHVGRACVLRQTQRTQWTGCLASVDYQSAR